MDPRPVWLLDVDGVINANKPGWGAAPRRISCAGFTIRWAPALLDRIRQIHRSGLAEIRWSTTWCGFPDQLAELSRALRVDLPQAFTDRPMSKTWAEVKAEAAVAVLAEGRRLVWTDDDEATVAPDFYPELVPAVAGGRALLIAPRSNRGLQPADMDAIEAFATDAGRQWLAANPEEDQHR